MRTWLALESLANWAADRSNGFRFLGIAEKRITRAKQAQAGDFIFVYVPSPIRAFADIRIVDKDGITKSAHAHKYDIPCYAGIATRPAVLLEKSNWLPLTAVRDKLSFGSSPAAGMRVSFKEINRSDASVLISNFHNRLPDAEKEHLRSLLQAA
jgi:hypothetical protein